MSSGSRSWRGAGAYDGVVFHRVIDGFMAQTGDVEFGTRAAFAEGRAGTGGSDLPDLPAEFSDQPFERGHGRHGAVAGPELGQQPVLHHVRGRRRT